MQIAPYLSFAGTCREAFTFYAECLGGTLSEMMTYGQSPMADQVPPGMADRIMHVSLASGAFQLMGSDAFPGSSTAIGGFSVSVGPAEPEEAERIFHALSAGGSVTMPMAQTFWARRFGMLTDKFGMPWMVNCE